MEWGVVVAADRGAEWLLKWWWECYSRHHKEPVAFIDFGMSEEARKWCAARGKVIPFEGGDFVKAKDELSIQQQQKWEGIYGVKVWEARRSWFKKPLAMLQSPFEKSVWMDLDCEVCLPIDGIFEGVEKGMLGAVRVEKRGFYNSGVIVYDRTAPLLHAWAKACLEEHGDAIGDETVLSKIIRKNKHPFKELEREYNWMMGWGYHPEIKVAHWAANWGKICIETMGGIQKFLANAME